MLISLYINKHSSTTNHYVEVARNILANEKKVFNAVLNLKINERRIKHISFI